MTFTQGLINARSHIIFIIGLFCSFGLVYYLETTDFDFTAVNKAAIEKTDYIPLTVHSDLTEQEQEWGQIAGQYFEMLNYAV